MNRELVDRVVNAVLYEGYILYPYRASSQKNQRERFTFGRIYPAVYSRAQDDREPCFMQTQCLVRDDSKDAIVQISIRFLHPIARESGKAGRWLEARERSIELPTFPLAHEKKFSHPFHFPASEEVESSPEGDIVRLQDAVSGVIEVAAERVDDVVSKLTIRIRNETPVPAGELDNQEEIVMRTLASAHTIIAVQGGSCLSLLDPPAEYEGAAKACKNIGCWPVLVGEEAKHENDAMLSSPIILYDYPKIAPESRGDLYDGTEIDEILTLRIQAMTDEEKAEMRTIDEHARRILERTEAMPGDHLLQMHGTMRDVSKTNEDFFNPTSRKQTVTINGQELKAGDRVRIRPKRRADAFDMMLSGKIGIIEAIEESVQDEVHVAVVLEDDPGRELGFARQPGHRFFYGADEVEPF